MQLSDRIGRRMKLHDLHVFMSVVQTGSMGKAAALLHTTQSAISRSVAELEHAVGVRLLERSRRGVETTEYGRALLDGGTAVFDDLRQAVKNIEYIANPTVGRIVVGGLEATNASLLPAIFVRLRRRYRGISMHVTPVLSATQQFSQLRDRNVDLVVGRLPRSVDKDIAAEVLFHDRMYVVAGSQNKWARRRKIKLSQLADEPWLLPPLGTVAYALAADMFHACEMEFPPAGATTGPIHMFNTLLANGPFLALVPGGFLRFGANLPALKILPLDVPSSRWPTGIMMLKDRVPSPVTKLFIECAREVVRPWAKLAQQ